MLWAPPWGLEFSISVITRQQPSCGCSVDSETGPPPCAQSPAWLWALASCLPVPWLAPWSYAFCSWTQLGCWSLASPSVSLWEMACWSSW